MGSQRLPSAESLDFPGLVVAKSGAVSAESPICSEIGAQILKDGGSAVDAIIASAANGAFPLFTKYIIHKFSFYPTVINSGGFMLFRSPKGSAEVFDFREEAPATANKDMYRGKPDNASKVGGLAVAVPGEIRGFEEAHKRHGKLPWKRLFEPSINISENGWHVSEAMETRLGFIKDFILATPSFREIFAPNGTLVKKGDLVRRTRYAKTLRALADSNNPTESNPRGLGAGAASDLFYRGWIGQSLLRTINLSGGIVTEDDFANYDVRIEEPVVGYYRGRKVMSVGLPASGPPLISILNILEGYDLHEEGLTPLNFHRDPENRNVSTIMTKFMTKEAARLCRLNISDSQTFDPSHYGSKYDILDDHGTSHISVIAPDGSAASMTTTVNLLFGAKIIDHETGIVLNDEMDDFSKPDAPTDFGLPPAPANFISPRKRPLSSTVPTIVENGETGLVEYIIGGSGGTHILTGVLQTLLNMIEYGMNAFDAVNDPNRSHHQLLPNEISVEYDFSPDLEAYLTNLGHKVKRTSFKFTGVGVIRRHQNGTIH
ncbi:hypothetical protein HK102_013883, partial [Quaeritorhiza haematococci]